LLHPAKKGRPQGAAPTKGNLKGTLEHCGWFSAGIFFKKLASEIFMQMFLFPEIKLHRLFTCVVCRVVALMP
jgi:hypothetical protein